MAVGKFVMSRNNEKHTKHLKRSIKVYSHHLTHMHFYLSMNMCWTLIFGPRRIIIWQQNASFNKKTYKTLKKKNMIRDSWVYP